MTMEIRIEAEKSARIWKNNFKLKKDSQWEVGV